MEYVLAETEREQKDKLRENTREQRITFHVCTRVDVCIRNANIEKR